MAWDAYKDSLDGYYVAELKKRGESGKSKLTKVGVFGLDGSPWMSTNKPWSIQAAPREVQSIASSYSQQSNPLATTGIQLGQMKFMYLRSDDTTIFGKKKGIGSLCVYKTKTALLMVVADESAQAGDVNSAVFKLGAYLVSTGM